MEINIHSPNQPSNQLSNEDGLPKPPSQIDAFYGKEGPTPKQVIFRDSLEKYKLFGGGVGGGKSRAICAEALRLSFLYPYNRGFLCRAEAEAFRRTTLNTLLGAIQEVEDMMGQKIIAHNGHNQTKKEIHLINGSLIMYGGLGVTPEDQDRIKSLEIGWYGVDEASEAPHKVVAMLKARLRLKLPDGTFPRYFGMYASNPEPGWLKDEFVTPTQLGYPLEDHIFVQSLIRDNPWLPPNYLDELKRDNPAPWVKRYVEGSWDAVEGQVWPDFDRNVHVYPNDHSDYEIPLPEEVKAEPFGGLDHGQTNPTAFLGAYTDADGNIFIYDEYYSKGLVSLHCTTILEKFEINDFETIEADPSMMAKTREKNGAPWSIFEEYDEYGISLSPANNSKEAGWNRVGEYLRVDPDHIHPITGKHGSPRIFFSSRCRNLLTEVPEYIWKRLSDESSNPKEEARKLKDHACDALRYLVMSMPSPYSKSKMDNAPYGSFNYMLQQKGDRNSKKGMILN